MYPVTDKLFGRQTSPGRQHPVQSMRLMMRYGKRSHDGLGIGRQTLCQKGLNPFCHSANWGGRSGFAKSRRGTLASDKDATGLPWREVVRKPGRGMRRPPLRQKPHFVPPFTSKTALVFDFSGSKITGPHGRAFYLRKCGVPYCLYGERCPGFQTRGPFSK